RSRHAFDLRLTAQLALGAHLACHTRDFTGERVELIDHRIDGVLELEDFALHVDRDLAGQVAARHSGRDLRDVSHLPCEVRGHRVDRVGQILPGTGNATHLSLTAELAVVTDLARHARHFASERVELVHHRVDSV